MRILCVSYVYAPSIGGIETMSATLVKAWTDMRHEVRVVTETPDPSGNHPGVIRQPSRARLRDEFRWCDVCYMNNISLHYLWPCLLSKKTVITAAKLPDGEVPGVVTRQGRIKRFFYARRKTVAISHYIAQELSGVSTVIPNCYTDGLFVSTTPWSSRDRQVVVLSRLVSEKGVDVAIRALHEAKKQDRGFMLTVIGSGPEDANLKALASDLGVKDNIRFLGSLSGPPLVEELNRHKLFVVPSVYEEPFGIVCLEGMACGCVVIASRVGGIIDAVGEAGLLFNGGDSTDLEDKIFGALGKDANPFEALAKAHLAKHTATEVGKAYLEVFEAAIGSSSRSG